MKKEHMQIVRKALSFDDVLLVPEKSVVESRNDISLSTHFLGFEFNLPIISANMSTVTEYDMAVTMHKLGGLGLIHRMNTIEDQTDIVLKCRRDYPRMIIGASIGIDPIIDIDRTHELLNWGCDIICVDAAHVCSDPAIKFLNAFLTKFPNRPLIIGNVATLEAIKTINDELGTLMHPRIAFKVGIGSGSQCTTRIMTGCGIPTLQSLIDIKKILRMNYECPYPIIADGGIKNSGDIVKSLAAGADMVMLGSLLAGTSEAHGKIIKHKGKLFKVYRGSASFGQKLETNRKGFVEGEETLVPYKGSAVKILEQLREGILSGCSYLGLSNLTDIKTSSPEFVEISNSGYAESTAHGA